MLSTPRYSPLASHWNLDRDITFLNHGSFGATPTRVLDKQSELRRRLELEPVRFMARESEKLWDESIGKTASFLRVNPSDLIFIKNTTMGVNIFFHSVKFQPGDEILTTSHVYTACINTMRHYAAEQGFTVKIAKVPFPVLSDEEVIQALVKEITPRTRLLFIDHITSATGLIFPIEKIISLFKEKGIEVFVDGAHAPGMIDLNIGKLGADYYAGNAHKWLCAPKGSAFLYVHPDKQAKIKPLQVSHTYDKSKEWGKQFFWPGTDDYTAYFCVPDAIEYMGKLFPGGWKELREHNRKLTLDARKLISEAVGTKLPAPDPMTGSLANICLGEAKLPSHRFNYIHPVQEELFSTYKIEVPVIVFPSENPLLWVRIAVQAYNDISQYEYLAEALRKSEMGKR